MLKTIEQKVLKFIDDNLLIEKGDKVVLALSGGADSVFLLHLLLKFKRRLSIDLSAFHLNHRIRGKDALEDEKFCRKLCSQNNIELYVASKDARSFAKKNKLSVEEAGRVIRYNELNKLAIKKGFTKIATAHNSGDNAETFLLNIIKGAGLKGLSGIPVRREKIIRPLLTLTADEIRKYLKKNRINYRLDRSNLGADYERNFLRNKIIPHLKKRLNPQIEQKILQSSLIIKQLKTVICNLVALVEKKAAVYLKDELKINLNRLKEFDKSILPEFFKYVIEKKFPVNLSTENINSVIKLAAGQTGKKLILPDKILVVKERTHLSFKPGKPGFGKLRARNIKPGEKVTFDNHTIEIKKAEKFTVKHQRRNSIEYISADGIKNSFQIRRWKEGDRFYPLGMKGSKKISDFLADEKIPSGIKKDQLVLTSSGKIVWVVGLRIDDRFKVTPGTKKVFKLSCL